MDIVNRQFLIGLRDAADLYASDVPNRHWQCAFLALSQAADHCDAMLARTECSSEQTKPDGSSPTEGGNG